MIKTDFDNKRTSLDKRNTLNKTKYLLVLKTLNEVNSLKAKD